MDKIFISIDQNNFFEVEGSIDVKSKKINFIITIEDLKKIFNISIGDMMMNKTIFYDNFRNFYIRFNDIVYSCFNCIFSYTIKDKISFFSISIDIIIENVTSPTENVITKNLVFHTYYLGSSINQFDIKDISFKISSTITAIIKTSLKGNFYIDIEVYSEKDSNYEQLSNIEFTIIEMLFLIIGDIPIIEKIYSKNQKDIIYHLNLANKYSKKICKPDKNGILGCINNSTLNRETFQKFKSFRKKTAIIYDVFMINMNSDMYKEIVTCNLVQIMEGLYKSLLGKKHLYSILEYFFLNDNISKKLLSRRDKRKIKSKEKEMVFLYKAKNQRNYLSHLDVRENKNVFYQLENIYAYWKLSMAIRLFIIKQLNLKVDKSVVDEYNKKIDEWASKKRLRFSSKQNKQNKKNKNIQI